MMHDLPALMHLMALGLCLCGIALLLLATEREGAALLRREIGPGARRRLRAGGAAVLALALWLCMRLWQPNFGLLLWVGWLSLSCVAAAFAAAFAAAWWPGQRPAPRRPATAARQATVVAGPSEAGAAGAAGSSLRRLRAVLALALLGLPLVFAWVLLAASQRPAPRADAVGAQAGPGAIVQEGGQPPQAPPAGVPAQRP